MLSDTGKLPPRAKREIVDPSNQLYVSVASLWEMQLKAASGKLILPQPFYQEVFALGSDILSISLAHIDKATSLPRHHRDPFDRMLIAQAQVEGMTLVSADRKAAAYDVPLLWS
jgi:PIN domain nuclease of toxin-antitoxin system